MTPGETLTQILTVLNGIAMRLDSIEITLESLPSGPDTEELAEVMAKFPTGDQLERLSESMGGLASAICYASESGGMQRATRRTTSPRSYRRAS